MRKFLFNTTALYAADDDKARQAEIAAERAKVKVTSVKIEDEEKEPEVEAKDDEEKKDDEQKEEDSEKEAEEKGDEDESESEDDEVKTKDEDKEDIKAEKRTARLEKKYARTSRKLEGAEKEIRDLKAKLAADPDKATNLSEEDVERLSEAKAEEKARIKERNRAADKLADDAQKQLKLTDRQWNKMVKEVVDEIGNTPAVVVDILADIDNGSTVIAHLFKNVDEAEEIYALANNPTKLALALSKLSNKLGTPKVKKISQVPDPVEPLGGKAATSDRLTFLSNKKNKTPEEMNEWVQARSADVAQKRANGRYNLR